MALNHRQFKWLCATYAGVTFHSSRGKTPLQIPVVYKTVTLSLRDKTVCLSIPTVNQVNFWGKRVITRDSYFLRRNPGGRSAKVEVENVHGMLNL